MPFRDSILEISPPFLVEEGGTAEAIQVSEGTALDGLSDWEIEGVLASMPGYGIPEALYLIGRDMQIDRGPTETDAHYITRLQRAINSHRVRGAGPELLKQLYAFFSPSTATPLRLVRNTSQDGITVWHEIVLATEVVTKTVAGANWVWDGYAARWWRGFVIIDSSAGPWTVDLWDLIGLWGDGGTWGSSAPASDIGAIFRIVDKWKPAHIKCVSIIVSFTATQFERTDASPPNPSGTSDTPAWRLGYNAIFWEGP